MENLIVVCVLMFSADDLQVIKEEASNESDYRINQGPELYLKEEKEEVSASPLTAGVWIFVLFQLLC